MSEENTQTQTTEEPQAQNPSTEASAKNVPYDRFSEVNNAKMVEDGKLKEALDIVSKERDSYKVQADEWGTFKTEERESLMSKLTTDEDKSIAEDLSLKKLKTYVNKVTNVSAPSTSSARAATGKSGDMGGYSSYAEWATKDPKSYQEANQTIKGTGIKIGYGD